MEFDQLVEEHSAAVERAIRKVLAKHCVTGADAEDLRAELWLYLWADHGRMLASFQGRSSLETYLFTVFFRMALKWQRKRLRVRRAELPLETVTADVSDRRLGASGQFGLADLTHLRQTIRRVRGDERELLLLRLKGHSYEEIARACNRPLRTIQKAVARAMTSLRRALGAGGEGVMARRKARGGRQQPLS